MPGPLAGGRRRTPADAGGRESYKAAATALRARIVERLADVAPWLDLAADQRQACVESDNCLDALVCALVAMLGLTVPPPECLQREARAERWIHLPKPGSLSRLLSGMDY